MPLYISYAIVNQALAESMGIETDWNCAISLRPLEDSTQPDPHRMTSSYADWDVKVIVIATTAAVCLVFTLYLVGFCSVLSLYSLVLPSYARGTARPKHPPTSAILRQLQARLPHGIAAILEHIERVDNVPLLVSLFTDATPATTKDMIGIYRQNHESVLAVGMSHRYEVAHICP